MIENYRGLYGEKTYNDGITSEHGGREDLKFGSGNESLQAYLEDDGAISAVYVGTSALAPESMTEDEIYAAFTSDLANTSNLTSGALAAGQTFASMLINAYGSSSDPLTGKSPRYGVDMLGITSFMFIYQLSLWKHAMSWRQSPGYSNVSGMTS